MAATLGTVYDRWIAHLGQVHASASYAFKGGDTPVKELSSIYIVGDTNNATECFISAHGGAYENDYFFDNDTFKVPAGTTMRFFQKHGTTLSFSTNALRLTGGQPMSEPGATDLVYSDGDQCTNYILTKDQGHHLGNFSNQEVDGWKMTYEGAQEVCGELGVVIILIRNRWFHAGVSLKNVIHDVQGAVPGIKTFNALFCRVDDNSTGSDWNARTGVAS